MNGEPQMQNRSAEDGKSVLSKELLDKLEPIIAEAVKKFDEELDKYNRFYIERGGLITLAFETKEAISVHLREVAEDRSPDDMARDFGKLLHELNVLAGLLQSHRKFRNVKEVLAYSWIVTEHGPLLERLGFRKDVNGNHPLLPTLENHYLSSLKQGLIPEEYRHIPPTLAVMNKEEFLQRYGS